MLGQPQPSVTGGNQSLTPTHDQASRVWVSSAQGEDQTPAEADYVHRLHSALFFPVSPSQTAAKEASNILDLGNPGQALSYCSLAILAGGNNPYHLRLRVACLTQLQEYDRALRDLDRVLQHPAEDSDLPRQSEDFCTRGRLLLSLGDKDGAAGAFTQALALAPAQAQNSLLEQPGQAMTASVFLIHGQRCLEEEHFEEAWTAVQNGLLVDPSHSGLKKLKLRTRKVATSGCRLH
jgi:tetratricopeptide (TPR) repeat protein